MQGPVATLIRRRLVCRGVVQGVGFRPAVCRLGRAFGLAGFVRNDAAGATIEVQGNADDVADFERRLPRALPPLAQLAAVEASTVPTASTTDGFVVDTTIAGARGRAMVPPDVALCAACRAELDDPHDRRHRHALLTCTDCGPRFALVHTLPYDRERTAMACFPMCARCAAEYADASSRRCHAETISCPDCGPQPWLTDAHGKPIAERTSALAQARDHLAAGAIVAIKGLGGFQLACRADDNGAVARLRQRKQRARKPLAVMVRDLATAQHFVQLDHEAIELLTSVAGPIVLAPRRADAPIADAVAPGLDDLGVMLPTTALHHELFRDATFQALVATSGNRSDEPICLGNREALARLAGIADHFLLHDRDIVRRVDDSVVRTNTPGPVFLRRSRGYVPASLPLPIATPGPVLALGGHLQATACLALDAEAHLSQHIGDLDSEPARAFLREVVLGLEQFLDTAATTIVCDTHPDYASSWLARELAERRGVRCLTIPHHLAHAAAVHAEHGWLPAANESATALVLDGTGHGADGTAWGSELLQFDGGLRWWRAAHGESLPLVGGERAVREPWRIAVAVLVDAGLGDRLAELPLATAVDRARLEAVAKLARSGSWPQAHASWPQAHGAGRLFEAAGALLGLTAGNDYEGEAAARLEAIAARAFEHVAPWPEVTLADDHSVLPQRALLVAAAHRLLAGEDPARIAAGLHTTFAALWVSLTRRCLPSVRTIALGGGCLVNRLLRRALGLGFAEAGCEVRTARRLPPGDGGLSYGQAALAAAALARGTAPTFVPFATTPLPAPRRGEV